MAKRPNDLVDVVVPLGGAQAEVSALIAQLRGSRRPYRLLLVDDAMTELRQGFLRKRLAASAGVECVWLRANGRGIVAALAVAREAGNTDVVLVDPRVRLADGWFDRLCRCAESDARIGVAATWTTADRDAPGFLQRLALGGMWHAPDIVDAALALTAVPVYPDVGIAVGPCMYLRRAVLAGAAKLSSLPALSASAHAAGYRVVSCDDVVAQRVPYGFDVGEPLPDDPAVGASLASLGVHDALAPLRDVLQTTVAMLERGEQPGILHVAHPRGGGTERYLRAAMAATAHSHRHYVLRIHHDRFTLEDARDDGFARYAWPRGAHAAPDTFLRDACTWLRIDLMHVHSLVGSGDDLLRALHAADVPYVYTAHDMYVPCPSVYLIGSNGVYCNATTDLATCRACLAAMPGLADVDIAAWRERHAVFMTGARRVIGPSHWAAQTVRAYYPDASTVTMPHGEPPVPAATDEAPDALELPADGARPIGFIGAIGPEKGARRIEAMAARIRERGLPLRLVVVGFMDREVRYRAEDDVLVVHGPYERRDLARLLDHYRIGAVAFPTVWPETYSYTLGEAWAAGRPALVPARGALGERVEETGAGWTLDPDAGIDAWLDLAMSATDPANTAELAARTARARAAAATAAAIDDPVVALYEELAVRSAAARPPYSHHAIYAAACLATGVAALPQATDRASEVPPVPGGAANPLVQWLRRLRGTAA